MTKNRVRHNRTRMALTGLLFCMVFIFVVNSEPVDQFVSVTKQQSSGTTEGLTEKRKEGIRIIEEMAQSFEEPPVNARIDPIWKAIPGYNGRKVDVEATLRKTGDRTVIHEEDLVFRETSPEIQLDDLEPAPIYRGNPRKPMIAFMVNVAWGNEYIPQLLEIFNRYDVRSTFFLDGSWLKKNVDLAEMIVREGHEIGNHAYSHPDMSRLSEQEVTDQIVKTNRLIQQELKLKTKWFAPPSGSFNERVVIIADRLGMKTVLWTLDTVDWKKPPPQTIVDRLVPKLDNGVLILMHPTESSLKALPGLIEAARKKGLIPGTVSEVLSPQRIDVSIE